MFGRFDFIFQVDDKKWYGYGFGRYAKGIPTSYLFRR
jgi:hypothetical protein